MALGSELDNFDGLIVGILLSATLGAKEGSILGSALGYSDRYSDGFIDANIVGSPEIATDGFPDIFSEGCTVGKKVGTPLKLGDKLGL
mmetsp:Transcript_15240/g.19880  ORF Transcript_15240/g.19880 Transcript_15240/m.19880 type:complete len:88 (-) Transcript_15240:391-654(-)